jgi:hypothetical protein
VDLKIQACNRHKHGKVKITLHGQGFSQREGVDYEVNFAPMAIYSSIETVISLVVDMGLHVHHMDVKNSFLNGVVEE